MRTDSFNCFNDLMFLYNSNHDGLTKIVDNRFNLKSTEYQRHGLSFRDNEYYLISVDIIKTRNSESFTDFDTDTLRTEKVSKKHALMLILTQNKRGLLKKFPELRDHFHKKMKITKKPEEKDFNIKTA